MNLDFIIRYKNVLYDKQVFIINTEHAITITQILKLFTSKKQIEVTRALNIMTLSMLKETESLNFTTVMNIN